MSEFCQELFSQPLLVLLFIWEKVVLEISKARLDLSSIQDRMPWNSSKQISEQSPRLLSWGPGVDVLLYAFFFLSLRISNLASVTTRQLSLCPRFHIPDQLFLVCKYEVQWRVPPLLVSSVTCTRGVRLLPAVWRQPCVLPLDKAVISRHPLEHHLCVCPLSNVRTPDWLIAHPQVELCAFQLLSHIKNNSPFSPPKCEKTSWTLSDEG